MFIDARTGIQRYDPLLKRKQQIIEDWSALPVNDRDETLQKMLDAYAQPEETQGDEKLSDKKQSDEKQRAEKKRTGKPRAGKKRADEESDIVKYGGK